MVLDLSKGAVGSRSTSSDRPALRSRLRQSQFAASLFCVVTYLAAIVVIWPVVELATDDDFAYSRMALNFLRTGHFVFNGWETTMVGLQVIWGALFIRLFGYSYLTLRLSTIVLGAALAFLLHRILLRSGVTGAPAVLGTLTVVLSPLFLPMATSYMTDVPAFFCIAISIYGCQRALRARSDRAALAWLCGSAALNVVDGTVRQIAWLGTLVIVPSGFWLLRNRRGFKAAGIVTWIIGVVAVALMMVWFLRQPYVLPEHIIRGRINGLAVWRVLRLCVYGSLEVFCFSLPVLIAWISELQTLSRRRKLQILVFGALITPLLFVAAHYNKIQGRLPPWSPNVVGRYGILWSNPLWGDRPEILPNSITSLFAIALIASLAGFILWLRTYARKDWFRKPVGEHHSHGEELSLYETCVLVLPFTLVYFSLLMPRAAFPSTFSDVWDRYFIPLIFVATLLLLRLLKERQREIPVTCYAMLLLFSFFSIAGTHDLFVAYRAVASVRAGLKANGIPLATVSGPWQEDGGNQIDAAGYMNDDRIQNPPGAYRYSPVYPLSYCRYWLGPMIPALHFDYVLTVEKLKCLIPTQYPTVTYRTWLPPFDHSIYTERPEPH